MSIFHWWRWRRVRQRKPRGGRLPEREALPLGIHGLALDRSRYAGSGQGLPTTEGSQATSGASQDALPTETPLVARDPWALRP